MLLLSSIGLGLVLALGNSSVTQAYPGETVELVKFVVAPSYTISKGEVTTLSYPGTTVELE